MKKMKSKKGFTLMEMLIVVAIIAILVAIAIPVMTSSLNGAKEAVDEANFRAAKAVASTSKLLLASGDTTAAITDGYEFDADSGTFVAAGGGYTAQGTTHSGTQIVIETGAGEYTVAWG